MKIQGNEIKPGMIIEFNNDYWTVLKTQHVKPGKGGAFNQVELKSLTKGTKLNQRFRSSENLERAQLDEKKFNFLYSNEGESFFMEPKTYEQISLKSDILGEKSKLLSENLEVIISFLEDKPLSIDLPNNIECTIESTEGVVKGQTAASSYKPAKLENGVSIMVPPFVEEGDKIILDTRSLEYVKKVN
jgi:elongation factor P|tara:strand:- start:3133 stop:3696 length:564 start_codon:yes stop_codon:yes gene_type:complete